MQIDKELFQKAYKKLKSSVYYDKTALILRNNLVQFEHEQGDKLETYLSKLYDAFTGTDEEAFSKLTKNIISTIKFHAFPKKCIKDENDETVLFNFTKEKTVIDELQYFIDMDINGHILGVVWLMMIGYRIDHDCIYEHSYGNRIRKNLYNEFTENPTYSPYLFEPYFQQYESWRDYGLKKAQECLKENRDTIIMTMDFKRFYYSVDLKEEAFESVLKDTQLDKNEKDNYRLFKRINTFVFKVIEAYSGLFKKGQHENRNILPIGFLPSNVLSNWCLRNFDKVIVDGWNPLYYGRYVDDILIVDKIEHNSDLYAKVKDQQITKDEIVHYLLQQCTRWNGLNSHCKAKKNTKYNNFAPLQKEGENKEEFYKVNPLYNPISGDNSNIKLQNKKLQKEEEDKEEFYKVNPLYNPIPGDKSKITLQNKKLKIFYFKSGETDSLITCFKKEISKNKSEFRFMPEDDAVFTDNDYSEIYDLRYEDTINKFRGIEKMRIDPYKLSKFLGKYLKIGSMVEDKVESSFAQDILKVFSYYSLVEHYMHWERILEILLINKQYEAIKKFVEQAIDAVKNTVLSEKAMNENAIEIEKIQLALYLELHSALSRVFSLAYGKGINAILSYIYTDEGINLKEAINNLKKKSYYDISTLRTAYNSTRMADKSVIPIPIEMLEFTNQETIHLTNFQEAYAHLKKTIKEATTQNQAAKENTILDVKYKYYPYLINMHEITLAYFLKEINNPTPYINYDNIKTNQEDLFKKLNYRTDYTSENEVTVNKWEKENHPNSNLPRIFEVTAGNKSKKRLRIAIANAKLDEKNFTNLVKGKPNRSYQRYCDVSHMVNQAMKEKADILVMPESYLPFEWLSSLARVCAANQLAIITGVEHFISESAQQGEEGKVYNFTAVILPYTDCDRRCAYISFHLKRHYSPREISIIRGYNYREIPGSNYELYHWNGCYFPVYCCFELASILERSIFQSYADFIVAVEWNHDTKYYSNIIESLSRDIHCYCIQVNTCDYGDSRITKPSKSEEMNEIQTKGGINRTILIGEIDIEKLRDFQIKEYGLQKEDKSFKPTPPEFDKAFVMKKIKESIQKHTS